MEASNRLFIVGLLVIQLVGVYAENRGDLSAQQSKESLLTIENAAAQPVTEYTPRILKKRSNGQSNQREREAQERMRKMEEARKRQQEQRDAFIRMRLEAASKKLDELTRIYNSRRGDSGSSRG